MLAMVLNILAIIEFRTWKWSAAMKTTKICDIGLRLISGQWECWDQRLENEDPPNTYSQTLGKLGACTNVEGIPVSNESVTPWAEVGKENVSSVCW